MDYKDVVVNARKYIGSLCHACDVCNGKACRNTIPGPGAKGRGDNAIKNYDAWSDIRLNIDTLVESTPVDTSFEIFGQKFCAPFFAGPVGAIQSHYSDKYDDLTYNNIMLSACSKAKIAAFTGDGKNPIVFEGACKAIKDNTGVGVPTVKPWDNETVFKKLELVKESNSFAVAMDIDAAGLPFLKNANPPAGSKTVNELKSIIKQAKKPFIVKGIMTVNGALKALNAGASAIVVSNHGGRVLDDSMPTAYVLEDIVKAVKGKMKIFVDGGIRSGADVFKALALGADAVLITRPFVVAVFGGEEEGVTAYINKIKSELEDAMKMCGASNLAEIRRDMVSFLK